MVLLALLTSLAYHLQLPLAGVVAVEALTGLINREIQGEIAIGELQNATYQKLVVRNVVVRDPEGREVIRASRVAIWPDFNELIHGNIAVERVRLRGGRVSLYVSGEEDEGRSVSIADAFTPVDPTDEDDEPSDLHIAIRHIVLDEVTVEGDVPSFEGLRVSGVWLRGDVDITDEVLVSVTEGHAVLEGPYRGRPSIDQITGFVSTVDGIDFSVRGHRREDRFEARFRLTLPDGDEPNVMDLEVEAAPIRIATVREMQVVEGLDALEGTFRGTARLHGPTDDLELNADLTSMAGRIHVLGHLPSEGAMSFEAWPEDELRLQELVPAAPDLVLSGRARIELDDPSDETAERRIHAELARFSIQDIQIPGFALDGTLEDEALVISELTSDVAGGETTIDGRVGFDGSLEAHVETRLPRIQDEPNVRRFAPDARGGITASLDIHADEGLANLRGDGRVHLVNPRYGAVRASSMTLRGHVGGELPAPDLRLTGNASALVMGDLVLGLATVSIHGGPGGYQLRAETRDAAAGTHLLVEGRGQLTEDAMRIDAPVLAVDLGPGEEFSGAVDLTFRPGQSVSFAPLSLSRDGNERIQIAGTYRFQGDDELDIELENVDLATLRPLDEEALGTLAGRLSATAEIRGDLDRRLQGSVTARLDDVAYRDLHGVDGRIQARLDGNELTTNVRVNLQEQGAVAIAGTARVSDVTLSDPSRVLEESDLEGLTVESENLDLALLTRLRLVEDLPVSGRLSTTLELTGPPVRPGLRDAIIILDHVAPEGWEPLRAKVHLSYAGDRVVVRQAWLADAGGELGTLEGDFPFSLDNLPDDISSLWHQLNEGSFSASIELAERRLDSWPRPLRDRMPTGLVVAARVTARSGESGPVATLSGSAHWMEAATEDYCARDLRPAATIEGQLEGEIGIAHVTGFLGAERSEVSADITANVPLEEWISTASVDRMPTTEFQLHLDEADLDDVPWLCSYGRGPVSGVVSGRHILGPDPRVGAILDLPELEIWGDPEDRDESNTAYRVHVRAGSSPDGGALTACAVVGLSGTPATAGEDCRAAERAGPGEMISRVRIPVSWSVGRPLPELVEDGHLSSWSDMRSVHIEPVLAFVPGIVSGDAVVNGMVEAAGVWPDVQLVGSIDVEQGRLQIEGLGQHLHGIEGRVELNEGEAVFPADRPIMASDAAGSVEISGRVGLEGSIPRDVDLSLRANGFPVRREGMVLAWLTGAATVGGAIRDERTDTTIRIHDFVVRLPERTAATLQSLEPHSEVRVVGEERPRGPGPRHDAYPIEIAINPSAADGSRPAPFWVRRNDFTAFIDANLVATYQDPELRVRGRADILRGTFEIFGKRFELHGGRLAFDGGTELDPLVAVTAVYDIPGRTGETVTVTVSGTLTAPVVTFTSTVTNDRAEIIGLLISGGRQDSGAAEREASQQAASFLTGIMAGILTLGLREELGDFIPVFAIESEGSSGTRIRAGYDANVLIPDFLRGIVTGAYVEGFFTAAAAESNAAGTSAGGGGVGGGVTVELRTPFHLLFRGTWVPVDNGSVDFLFEP